MSRLVNESDRDSGVPNSAIRPDEWYDQQAGGQWPHAQRRILLALLAAPAPAGRVAMLTRADLKTSANMMQQLYYAGWVNGAGSRDARGMGNTPESSWWWLTRHGEKMARAIPQKPRSARAA